MKTILLMSTIVLTTISCSRKIDLAGHYDSTQSFEVVEHRGGEPYELVGPYEIQVNDVRHAKLLAWLALNNQEWKRTHNEWAGLVWVYQENFKLLLYRNSEYAVVIITDEKNKSRYYRRTFDNDGLKFLDE